MCATGGIGAATRWGVPMWVPKQLQAQDVVRVIGNSVQKADPAAVARRIEGYLLRKGCGWGYGIAKTWSPSALAGHVSDQQIDDHCAHLTIERAKAANVAVLKGLAKAGRKSGLIYRPAAEKVVEVSAGLAIRISPLGYSLSADGNVCFLLLQPRQGHIAHRVGLGLWASIVREEFAVDEFDGASVAVLDLSKTDSEARLIRSVEVLGAEALPQYTRAEVDLALAVYAEGYRIATSSDNVRARYASSFHSYHSGLPLG